MTTASQVTCTAPKIGSRLPDYILDLLDDKTAEEVDTHLANCAHCKRLYETVLQFQATRGRIAHDKITPTVTLRHKSFCATKKLK